ncbi:MAG TPA: hypothetical protein QF873_03385 [Patescibacteria group bacterium]|nr:hypothetical protein [Patescibacteria group bacterium]
MSTDRKSIFPFLVGGAIALILVAALAYIMRGPEIASPPTVDEVVDVLEQPRNISNYDYVLADDWEDATVAENTINESQGKDEGQEKIFQGVIRDPNIEELFYFATIDESDDDEIFLGIYKYDTITRNWERLYKETNEVTESESSRYAYNVLGFDRNQLVIKRTSLNFIPGLCYEPLLSTTETTTVDGEEVTVESPRLGMGLLGPYGKWSRPDLPEDVRTQYEERQQECEPI